MTGRAVVASATFFLAAVLTSPAVAAQDDMRFGLRVGFGASESALVFGIHANNDIEAVDGLSFEPVAQLGLGSQDPLDYKIFELVPRVRYDFPDSGDLTPFGFAGISLYRFSVEVPETPIGDLGASRTDVAFTFGGGVEKNGFGVEGAIGVSAISSLQILARYTFGG